MQTTGPSQQGLLGFEMSWVVKAEKYCRQQQIHTNPYFTHVLIDSSHRILGLTMSDPSHPIA